MGSTRQGAGGKVIGFAHRGAARTKADQNTLTAFERALSLGAGGLETDVELTADGVPVLLHPRLTFRRRLSVSRLRRHELPPAVPSLADLYDRCGHDFELSLDVTRARAAEVVLRTAREYGAVNRLWLNYWKLPALEAWREEWPTVRLVYATIPLCPGPSTPLMRRLARLRVDAINIFHRFCTVRLIERAHAQSLLIFAWGIRGGRSLERVLARGVDAVYCDDVPGMVEIISNHSAR
jgi:glycerophosphoryl diester phosphodiesterase